NKDLCLLVIEKIDVEVLPNWILAGKHGSCELFVNDHSRGAILVIVPIERSSAKERNTHRLEMIWADGIKKCFPFVGGRFGIILRREIHRRTARKRKRANLNARGFDSSYDRQSIVNLSQCRTNTGGSRCAFRRERRVKGQDIVCIKAWIHIPQARKAPDHQSGANQ